VTVWRRFQEWNQAGVWQSLHETLLGHLGRAGAIDPSLVVADSSSCRAVKGGSIPDPTRPIGAKRAANAMC
jgi:transposase